MKINEAFLARLRELKRNPADALPGASHLKNMLDGLTAGTGTTHNSQTLPTFVTNLLDQLGVTLPGATTAERKPHAHEQERAHRSPATPGQFTRHSFACLAGTRDYKLYIPKSYTGQPLPLVLMLHGCTQTADDFALGTRANQLADELGFIVAYPEQSASANNHRCWNWFQPGDQRAHAGEPAILAGVVREVMAGYAVDPARIYVGGMSAGGAMAAIMAAAYPDLFAAAGVHSGLPVGVASDVNGAMAAMRDGGRRAGLHATDSTGKMPPTIIFHGDEDRTVHPRNAEALLAQCIAGRLSQSVEEEGTSPGGRSYTRTSVLSADGDSIAELWLLRHAGHTWAGGDARGTHTDAKGPDATREMLKFFLAHPRHSGLAERIGDAIPFLRG